MRTVGGQSETGRLVRVAVKHAADAFRSEAVIDREWRALRYVARPERAAALAEYERFLELLAAAGVEIVRLPADERVSLDSLYVRDASVVCDAGLILCNMGKPERRTEPSAAAAAFEAAGVPIHGRITGDARLEGGDVCWITPRTVAVGQGYRTNAAGIGALRGFLADLVDEVIVVPLPHWRGPDDVFHLMSMVSPIDRDLFLVYARLLPVPFRDALLARGIDLVEVPDAEFETLGVNVLALGGRAALTVSGNPVTRSRLEAAGVRVEEFAGREICLKGGGGPTCLTRPLARVVP